jgi:fatty-acyl-CoA synthase
MTMHATRPASSPGPLFFAGLGVRALGALARAGLFAPVRPDRLPRMLAALRHGFSPATACRLAAARTPDRPAVIDERGALSFAALDRRSAAIAAALSADFGVGPGRGLAVMCRNHRGFVEALLAAARLGADLLLLNTEFPGPQLAQALRGQSLGAIVLDEEFAPRLDDAGFTGPRIHAWLDSPSAHATPATLDALAAQPRRAPPAPRRRSKIIILTSGTTGAPKGAPRAPSLRALLGPLTTLLSQIGLRAGEPLLVAPPLFHGFGLAYLALSLFLGSALVLRRKFDPEATLATIAEHRVASLVAVPVMLRRILEVPESTRRRYDTSSLRAAICAGAPLDRKLATDFMDGFGDVVYNLYGSTETGFGSIAAPSDLRAAPGTVGRPPFGTTLKILTATREEAPLGQTGWIFIGGPLVFAGYSDGGNKELAAGLMNTGDLGHFDDARRLFIDGREDDMIVSGGENVFPHEVEEVLARHHGVDDVAVLGVPDEEFGQRLKAFVVRRAAASPSEDELKAHVKAHLARYKVPREVIFVDQLPRNSVGKVQRTQLARLS